MESDDHTKGYSIKRSLPLDRHTVWDRLWFPDEHEVFAKSKSSRCHTFLLVVRDESPTCYKAMLAGLKSRDIVAMGDYFDFVSFPSQRVLNQFFDEGNFNLWSLIARYVRIPGKNIKADSLRGANPNKDRPTGERKELIDRLYGKDEQK